MEALNEEVVNKIVEYLRSKEMGASASEISKDLSKNRITVTKYLEIMKSHGVLENQQIAQAKYWKLVSHKNRPKILVVDDDTHIRELVKLSLAHRDYDMKEAYDGVEALEKIREESPDLIILDLMMPRLDGFEVCEILRQNPRTQHIPVIMLTAKTQIIDKVEGLRKGADDYITKPFNPLELEARVDAVFARYDSSVKRNPVTELPAYDALMEKLSGTKAKIILMDVVNFRDYNRQHGFKKGNDVLKLISRAIRRSVKQFGSPEDFISHIGSDDFVVLTYGDANRLVDTMKSSFDRHIKQAFPETNLEFTFATVDSLDFDEDIRSRDMDHIFKKAKAI
jgi:DNA-binding response OmpR family regulator